MPAPSGFLSALGQMFQGYAQDEQGRFQRDQRQQETSRANASLDLQRRNIEDEIRQRNAPKPPKRVYDAARGAMVNEDDGTAAPVAGLPAIPEKPIKSEWEQAGYSAPGPYLAYLRQKAQATHITEPRDTTQILAGKDAEGKDVYREYNKTTHQLGPVLDIAPRNATAGQSGTQQLQQGRMLAAISEARMADKRMREYEDRLVSGTEKISPLAQMGGNLASNLAGSHEVLGAGVQALSEGGLNMTNPQYAQYLRDAATIGRAEQMIMPRGGTETMVRANALLARAGTGASKATIEASRMARQALFGHAGGLAQAMTPQQAQGVDAGIQKITSGETGAASTSQITPAERSALKAQGFTDAQITAKYGAP